MFWALVAVGHRITLYLVDFQIFGSKNYRISDVRAGIGFRVIADNCDVGDGQVDRISTVDGTVAEVLAQVIRLSH